MDDTTNAPAASGVAIPDVDFNATPLNGQDTYFTNAPVQEDVPEIGMLSPETQMARSPADIASANRLLDASAATGETIDALWRYPEDVRERMARTTTAAKSWNARSLNVRHPQVANFLASNDVVRYGMTDRAIGLVAPYADRVKGLAAPMVEDPALAEAAKNIRDGYARAQQRWDFAAETTVEDDSIGWWRGNVNAIARGMLSDQDAYDNAVQAGDVIRSVDAVDYAIAGYETSLKDLKDAGVKVPSHVYDAKAATKEDALAILAEVGNQPMTDVFFEAFDKGATPTEALEAAVEYGQGRGIYDDRALPVPIPVTEYIKGLDNPDAAKVRAEARAEAEERLSKAEEAIGVNERVEGYYGRRLTERQLAQKQAEAQGIVDAFGVLADNPGAIVPMLLESMVANPLSTVGTITATAAVATAASVSAPVTMTVAAVGAVATGAMIAGEDYRMELQSRIAARGLSEDERGYGFRTGAFTGEKQQARRHATMVGSFGAMGTLLGAAPAIRAASTFTVPTLTRGMTAGLVAGNAATDTAGEIAGQYAADGRISDPTTVALQSVFGATSGLGDVAGYASVRARARIEKAREQVAAHMDNVEQAAATLQEMQASGANPQAVSVTARAVEAAAGVPDGVLRADADALYQEALNGRFEDNAKLAAEIEAAHREGRDVNIPLADYANEIKPNDTDGVVARNIRDPESGLTRADVELDDEIIHEFAGEMAKKDAEDLAELKRATDDLMEITADAEDAPRASREPARIRAEREKLKAERAAARKAISEQRKALNKTLDEDIKTFSEGVRTSLKTAFGESATPQEISAVVSLVSSAFSSMSKITGIPASELWRRYGIKEFEAPDGSSRTGVSGYYNPATGVLGRWTGLADKSEFTLVHEFAHMFLEYRGRLAEDLREGRLNVHDLYKGNKQAIIESTDALAQWLGVERLSDLHKMNHDARKELHEKFARSFEQYVAEGVAPNNKLTRAFSQFASWSGRAYGTVDGLVVPDSAFRPGDRQLFSTVVAAERMLDDMGVTDDVAGIPLLDGDTPETFAKRSAVRDEAAALLRKSISESAEKINVRLRELTQAVRTAATASATRARERADARLAATPWGRAVTALTDGRVRVDGDPEKASNIRNGRVYTRLSAEWLKEEMGFDAATIKVFVDNHLATTRESWTLVDPEGFARAMGFTDASEMLIQMLDEPSYKKRVEKEALADLLASEKWTERESAAERESVVSYMYNSARADLLASAMRSFQRLTGFVNRYDPSAAKAAAVSLISGATVRDIRRGAYTARSLMSAVRREEREARKCFDKGNYIGAVGHLYNALVRTNTLVEARVARTNIDRLARTRRRYSNKNKGLSVDIYAREVIQRALELTSGVDTSAKYTWTEQGPNARFEDILRNLAERPEGFGEIPSIDPDLLAALNGGRESATAFLGTIKGVRALQNFVDSVEHLGRQLNSKKAQNYRSSVDKAVTELADQFSAYGGESSAVRTESDINKSALSKARDTAASLYSSHMRIYTWLESHAGSTGGAVFEHILKPALDAEGAKGEMRNKYTKKVGDIIKPIRKGLRSRKRYALEAFNGEVSVTKQEAWVMLLNLGNDGNRTRLLAGLQAKNGTFQGRTVTMDHINSIITQVLTDEEIASAQKIWDVFAEIQPLTEAVQTRLTGKRATWVKPREVVLTRANGREIHLTGGYYPIVYDSAASSHGAHLAQVPTEGELTPSALTGTGGVSSVSTGHLQDRALSAPFKDAPLTLTARALFSGLDRQIHYVTMAETVQWLYKVCGGNGGRENAFTGYLRSRYGKEAPEMLAKWVQDVATGDGAVSQDASAVVARMLRRHVSIAGVGLNMMTALLQVVGYTQSVVRIGPKAALHGIAMMLGPGAMDNYRHMMDVSPLMRDRSRTRFRELAEVHRDLNSGLYDVSAKYASVAYKPLVAMQMLVDVPTWQGAYAKALREGFSDADAARQADLAVIDSQGSGRMSELSAVERNSSEWSKLFTVFYTFFNTALNLTAYTVGMNKDSPFKALTGAFTVLAIQPMLETVLRALVNDAAGDRDAYDDMDLQLLSSVVSFDMGLFVGLRELSDAAGSFAQGEKPRAYGGPTGTRKYADILRVSRYAYDNGFMALFDLEEPDARRLWYSLFGIFFGAPTAALGKLDSGITDGRGNPVTWFVGAPK